MKKPRQLSVVIFAVLACVASALRFAASSENGGIALQEGVPKTTRSLVGHEADASGNAVLKTPQETLDSADLLIAKINSTATGPFTWTQRFPSTSPPSRQGFAMAYDAGRGQAIVFGGDIRGVSGASLAGDTWAWDGTGWSQKFPAVSPPARDRPAMSYDAARGQLILFGGRGNGFNFDDTWTWDGSTWTQRTPSQSPPSRYSAALAYDSARGQVLVFGGFTANPPGAPVSMSNDTWIWDGSTWTQEFPSRSPSPRSAFAMAYDSSRQQIVLFGGVDSTATLSDTWVWDGSNWTQKTSSITPAARYSASMAYDQSLGQVVLFGGAAANNAPLDDTWAWDGTSWTQLDTSVRPTARFSGGLIRDDARAQLVLFGGSSNAFDFDHLLNDTWVGTTIPLIKQNDPLWGGDLYDHLNQFRNPDGSLKYAPTTITRWGCGLTSLVMVIRSYGVTVGSDGLEVTPKNLNNWLESKRNGKGVIGYVGEGNVNWGMVDEYTGYKVHCLGKGSGSFLKIEEDVNADRRVIARVANSSHFVVITKKSGSTFLINDPLWNRVALDDRHYNNTVNYTWRFERTNGTPTKMLSVIAKSPVDLIIIDPLGRRTGLDPVTGIEYDEIPGASYVHDGLASEDLPEDTIPPVSNEPVKAFYLSGPTDGIYQVKVMATGAGDYAIDVNETDAQGIQASDTVFGTVLAPSSLLYAIGYDTHTGTLQPDVFLRTVTGRVIDGSGNGVSATTVTLSGTQSSTALTDSNGNYSFGTLPAGGNYTITPWKATYNFNPDIQTFSNLSTSQIANFTATPTAILTPLQVLLEEPGPVLNQAAVLDSVLFLRDPFPVVNGADLLNLGADRNTRVIVFALNLQLAVGETSSSVVVNLIDSNNESYDLAAEDVRTVPGFEFTQVIFRLPANLPVGTCTIKIKAHGQISNAGTMRIRI